MNHLCALKVGKCQREENDLVVVSPSNRKGQEYSLSYAAVIFLFNIRPNSALFRAAPKVIINSCMQTWRGLFFKDFLQGLSSRFRTANNKRQASNNRGRVLPQAYYLRKKHRFFSPRARRCSRGAEEGHVYTVVAGHIA